MVKEQTNGKGIVRPVGLHCGKHHLCLLHQFPHALDAAAFHLRQVGVMENRRDDLIAQGTPRVVEHSLIL